MAIDRYAKRLTEEEDYDRALAIVTKATDRVLGRSLALATVRLRQMVCG